MFLYENGSCWEQHKPVKKIPNHPILVFVFPEGKGGKVLIILLNSSRDHIIYLMLIAMAKLKYNLDLSISSSQGLIVVVQSDFTTGCSYL